IQPSHSSFRPGHSEVTAQKSDPHFFYCLSRDVRIQKQPGVFQNSVEDDRKLFSFEKIELQGEVAHNS
ncbi:hypothetical protein J0S82_010150, partial [Galemys pyrenaicus]